MIVRSLGANSLASATIAYSPEETLYTLQHNFLSEAMTGFDRIALVNLSAVLCPCLITDKLHLSILEELLFLRSPDLV